MEGKDTAFSVRKRSVDARKISRFIRDHDIPDARSQMSRKFCKCADRMSRS
jgi:hypothetical protein